jgi:hypothetical protein
MLFADGYLHFIGGMLFYPCCYFSSRLTIRVPLVFEVEVSACLGSVDIVVYMVGGNSRS